MNLLTFRLLGLSIAVGVHRDWSISKTSYYGGEHRVYCFGPMIFNIRREATNP